MSSRSNEKKYVLSIVVPALNEEQNVAPLVEGLSAVKQRIVNETAVQDVEFIFVNDGSTDRTLQVMRRYEDVIRIVSFDKNQGYGAALLSGFEAATGDTLAFLDCDCTCDPASLIRMCQVYFDSQADLVIGNRMDRRRSRMPATRRLGNWLFAKLLTFLSGKQVTDTASGIRVFDRSLLSRLYPLPTGLNFTPAMTARAVHEKMNVQEIAVDYAERAGASKLNVFTHGFQFLWTIMDSALRYNPLKVFGAIALGFFVVATALLAQPAYDYLTLQEPPYGEYIYRFVAALAAFLTGCQVLIFAVVGGVVVHLFFHQHNQNRRSFLFLNRMRVFSHLHIYGIALFVLGAAVGAVYTYQHFISGGIRLHWSWFVAAVGCWLGGIQILSGSAIIKVMRDIQQAKATTGSGENERENVVDLFTDRVRKKS